MEPIGFFLDEEWESLTKMFSTEEADHLMVHLNGHDESDDVLSFGISSNFWPSDHHHHQVNPNMAGLDQNALINYSNFHYFSQESNSNSSGSVCNFFPTPTHEEYHFYDSTNQIPVVNNMSESMGFLAMDQKNDQSVPISQDNAAEDILCSNEDITVPVKEIQIKRKFEDKNKANKSDSPKNKTRVSIAATQSKKKKKNPKLIANGEDEEETNVGPNGQSSSCYSSEDDSNASQELNGGANSDSKALNLNGKTRAIRGSATDPQSLYARKRRERINERLRILQNLVPNGTKVDISTMLEEAVHYVKFLQIQIKLLSSDDMWMYAPLAYNGMDMGLYQKISPIL